MVYHTGGSGRCADSISTHNRTFDLRIPNRCFRYQTGGSGSKPVVPVMSWFVLWIAAVSIWYAGATKAPEHEADIIKAQTWLGHEIISTSNACETRVFLNLTD